MADSSLSVDRTITLTLVFALIIQTTSGLLWAGGAAARLTALEVHHNVHPPLSERLTRIEEQMEMTRHALTRIEARLDAAQPKGQP